MNRLIACIVLTLVSTCTYGNTDSILHLLKQTIDKKEVYAQAKEARIAALKQQLNIGKPDAKKYYEIYKQIYEEYWQYQTDSATTYCKQNLALVQRMGNANGINEWKINLGVLYSITGRYIEAMDMLQTVDKKTLPPFLLCEYYRAFASFYNIYAQSNNRVECYVQSDSYRDSMLYVMPPESVAYKLALSQKEISLNLWNGETKDRLLYMLEQNPMEDSTYAFITYLLGEVYERMGEREIQKKYYSMSGIADLKNVIRDNASLQKLALLLFNEGDVKFAYLCAQLSMDDAIYCNVRYRTIEGANINPIITQTYELKEKGQKQKLQTYLILIIGLSIFLVVALMYIYIQMKKLWQTRKAVHKRNLRLKELNENLEDVNKQLKDANRIKEEYIAHAFDMCSSYIFKI